MKRFLLFLFLNLPLLAFSQTVDLINFEVTLIGPYNTDRHHSAQVDYYLDYFDYLEEEVDLWLSELEEDLKGIKKRNQKRIDRKKPIKQRDYPAWKKKNQLVKELKVDKQSIQEYIALWENFDLTKPDSVARVFMNEYEEKSCYDLISAKLVLAPKEYKISLYEPESGFFDWNEYIPKTGYLCPQGYRPNGKNCRKNIELEVDQTRASLFIVRNLLTDLPFHLDGFKQITCR